MKTKKLFRVRANLKLLLILLVIATSIVALSSCGKNKNAEAATELAPPPPPPPPPPVPALDEAFAQVEEMPMFPGGDTMLLKFISNNTVYPKDAKEKNISGRVVVRFIVEKDGSVSNAEIIRGVNPSLDAESVRVVSSLPKFEKPGKQGGQAVRVYYMVPITFALK
jgi:protein TonB